MTIKEKVKSIIDAQQEKGFNKYGVYVDDANLTATEWVEHAQEENSVETKTVMLQLEQMHTSLEQLAKNNEVTKPYQQLEQTLTALRYSLVPLL